MVYRRSGRSGILLPAISLGLWHNFGGVDPLENSRAILRRAFDLGITHIDLANNYGPPYGSAEQTFGRALKLDLAPYRDELIVSTKAGYDMWPGPYGNWGSRKYLLASLDQSLARMGLEYVDIFYHHRPDPETPLEETIKAFEKLKQDGKIRAYGVSNFDVADLEEAVRLAGPENIACNQVLYNLKERSIETGVLPWCAGRGISVVAYSPLSTGELADAPELREIALTHNVTTAQVALSFLVRHKRVFAIPKSADSHRVIENLGAGLLELTPHDIERIEKAFPVEKKVGLPMA